MTSSVLLVVAAVLLLLRFFLVRHFRNKLPLPPGPVPDWFFGNAKQIPTNTQWLGFAKWGEIYGGFVFFRVFRAPYLIINAAKPAFDLLDKKSNIYSDRPISIMASELIGWDFNMTLIGYGETWRKHRKVMHQALQTRVVPQYHALIVNETHKFMQNLNNAPEDFLGDIRRLAASTIMLLTYGYEVKPNDSYISLVEEAVDGLTQTLGVGFLVDVLPILKYIPAWFPGAGFQRLAQKWRVSTRGILELPWTEMKENYVKGIALPSYCTKLLDAHGGLQCDTEVEEIVKQTSAVIYAAGGDSTVALISSFFLAMTLHPDVQRRAQAEIDAVVGRTRLPTFADRPNLPYLECVIKETYRWNPAAPLGVPHRLMQDDEYEGYLVPAGTTVIPNIWALLHDPSMYPSPMSFTPSRFESLSPEEQKSTDPRNFMFGFGRRTCPGQPLADAAVYIALASILAHFDILQKTSSDGKEIIPEVVYPQFVGHPKPFLCNIKAREGVRSLVTLVVNAETAGSGLKLL